MNHHRSSYLNAYQFNAPEAGNRVHFGEIICEIVDLRPIGGQAVGEKLVAVELGHFQVCLVDLVRFPVGSNLTFFG